MKPSLHLVVEKAKPKTLYVVRRDKQKRKKYFKDLNLSVLENPSLSGNAKTVHTYLISRYSGSWQIHRNHILSILKGGEWTLKKAIKELEAEGYLLRERPRTGFRGGYGKTIYYVFEEPYKVMADEIEEAELTEKINILVSTQSDKIKKVSMSKCSREKLETEILRLRKENEELRKRLKKEDVMGKIPGLDKETYSRKPTVGFHPYKDKIEDNNTSVLLSSEKDNTSVLSFSNESKNTNVFLLSESIKNNKNTLAAGERDVQVVSLVRGWNDKAKKYKCSRITAPLTNVVLSALKHNTFEELLESINNYHNILSDPNMWFSAEWNLYSFFARGHPKYKHKYKISYLNFLSSAKPFDEFRKKEFKNKFEQLAEDKYGWYPAPHSEELMFEEPKPELYYKTYLKFRLKDLETQAYDRFWIQLWFDPPITDRWDRYPPYELEEIIRCLNTQIATQMFLQKDYNYLEYMLEKWVLINNNLPKSWAFWKQFYPEEHIRMKIPLSLSNLPKYKYVYDADGNHVLDAEGKRVTVPYNPELDN